MYQTSAATDLPGRWRRYIPDVSCCANLVLLFTLDWVSIVFGLQLMGVGFLIYFFYSRKRRVRARTGMSLVEAIRHHDAKSLYRIEITSSDRPLDFLVVRSADVDLFVVGATKVKFLEKAAVGPFSSQIAMRSDCSVAVVRVAPSVKKIMPI